MLISMTDCLMFYLADYEYVVGEDDWIIYNHKEYYFSREPMPMERARDFCKKNGGDLAVIEGESEKNFLWKYVRNMFYLGKCTVLSCTEAPFSLACEILKTSFHHKKISATFHRLRSFTIIIILLNCYM